MTTAAGDAGLDEIPDWDVADRMRKCLRERGIGVQQMADYFGVSRNTISTWINGRIEPSTPTVRLWALRCGVPFEWLKDGMVPSPDPVGPAGLEPATYGLQVRTFPGLVVDLTVARDATTRRTWPLRRAA